MPTAEYRAKALPFNRSELAEYDIDATRVDELVADRAAARRAKDFALADRIRGELEEMDIRCEDHPGEPTYWYFDHMRRWKRQHRG